MVLMLKKKGRDVPSTFKYQADKIFGVHSICITEGARDLTQYMVDVAVKANLRVGDINYSIQWIADYLLSTLAFGADVTHPRSTALGRSPSLVTIVGSVEETSEKFLGFVTIDKVHQQIKQSLFHTTDFLLWSNSGIKGTMKPTEYFVLKNGMGISADLQELESFSQHAVIAKPC
ncbi:hypothetical protein CC78DRAFT_574701 [Lojkania enalia]|uniref:Piwi domain-containing protein n=1 Tax=Lojkania enalia TaxID=147567 RepID=A0A9P4TQQ3_9PLEO|nr:hypothetical protein CC78DRAFT_574701 [Didymosphaeria enalia]